MYCRQCGEELPPPVKGHRRREFCDDACKQAHYRQALKAPDNAEALASELQEALDRIDALEREASRLRGLLDVERRYYEDTQARPFKSWLRQQSPSPLREKLLAHPGVMPPRGSRSLYEAHLRKLGATSEEQAELAQLWKRMLVQQS